MFLVCMTTMSNHRLCITVLNFAVHEFAGDQCGSFTSLHVAIDDDKRRCKLFVRKDARTVARTTGGHAQTGSGMATLVCFMKMVRGSADCSVNSSSTKTAVTKCSFLFSLDIEY